MRSTRRAEKSVKELLAQVQARGAAVWYDVTDNEQLLHPVTVLTAELDDALEPARIRSEWIGRQAPGGTGVAVLSTGLALHQEPGASGDDAPVLSYPSEAVLELRHVAAWLRISERSVERLDIPFSLLGKRTKRYLAGDVIEYLHKRRIS